MKEKIYVFDLDGTLVDSMPTGVGIVLGYLDAHGVAYPDDIVKKLTPLGYKGTAKYCVEALGAKGTPEELYAYFQEKTLQAYKESIPLKPHVKETLETLRSQGYRLNVLTASPSLFTVLCLRRLGVLELFENVWSIDDFSLTKADERIYVEAAARLGVTPTECIMADDNVNVLKTAKRAGMRTVGVYDESSADAAEEMLMLADGYVRDFAEILAL